MSSCPYCGYQLSASDPLYCPRCLEALSPDAQLKTAAKKRIKRKQQRFGNRVGKQGLSLSVSLLAPYFKYLLILLSLGGVGAGAFYYYLYDADKPKDYLLIYQKTCDYIQRQSKEPLRFPDYKDSEVTLERQEYGPPNKRTLRFSIGLVVTKPGAQSPDEYHCYYFPNKSTSAFRCRTKKR